MNTFLMASLTVVVYAIIQFMDAKMVQKERPDIKAIVKRSAMVFSSVIAGMARSLRSSLRHPDGHHDTHGRVARSSHQKVRLAAPDAAGGAELRRRRQAGMRKRL